MDGSSPDGSAGGALADRSNAPAPVHPPPGAVVVPAHFVARSVPPPPPDSPDACCATSSASGPADDAVSRSPTVSPASHGSGPSRTFSFRVQPTVSTLSAASHGMGPSRTMSFRVQPTVSTLSAASHSSGPSRTMSFRMPALGLSPTTSACLGALTVTLSRPVPTTSAPSPGSWRTPCTRPPNPLASPAAPMDVRVDIEGTPSPQGPEARMYAGDAASWRVRRTVFSPDPTLAAEPEPEPETPSRPEPGADNDWAGDNEEEEDNEEEQSEADDWTPSPARADCPVDDVSESSTDDCFAAELCRILQNARNSPARAAHTRIAATTFCDWTARSESTDRWPKAPHEHYAVRGLTAMHVLVRDCSDIALVSFALEHVDSLAAGGGLSEVLGCEQSSWDTDGDDQCQPRSLGFCPIHIAARYGTSPVFELLLQKGGATQLTETLDANGARPVHHAAANSDNPDVLTRILTKSLSSSSRGGDLFVKDASENLPAHYAAMFAASGETIRVLTRGAGRLCRRWWKQMSTANAEGMCAIHCVAERHGDYAAGSVEVATAMLNDAETAQALLKQPLVTEAENGDDLLAVHLAAQWNAPVLKLVLDTGGPEQAHLSDHHGNLPIHYSGLNEDVAALQSILDVAGPAALLSANQFGNRRIHYAAQHSENDAVLDLIFASGGLEQLAARNNHGMEPLHCAALRQGSTAAMTRMMKGNAEVNSRDNEGVAPLDIAVREDHADCAQTLLQFGADSSSATEAGDVLTLRLRWLDEQTRGVGQPTHRTLFGSPKVPSDPIVTALIEHGADTTKVPADLDAIVKVTVQRAVSQTTMQSVLQRRQLRSGSGFLTPLQAARLRLAFATSLHSRLATESTVALYLYEGELVQLIGELIVAKRQSQVFREDAAQALAAQQRERGLLGEPMLLGTRVCVDGEEGVIIGINEEHQQQTRTEAEADGESPVFPTQQRQQRVRFLNQGVKLVALDTGTRDPKTWAVLPKVVFDASEAQAYAGGGSSEKLSHRYEYYSHVSEKERPPVL